MRQRAGMDLPQITTWVAILAAGAIALGRFIAYIQAVDDIDVEVGSALAWWGAWLAGVALVIRGAAGEREDATSAWVPWAALLVGILVLVVMPAIPAGNVDLSSFFGP